LAEALLAKTLANLVLDGAQCGGCRIDLDLVRLGGAGEIGDFRDELRIGLPVGDTWDSATFLPTGARERTAAALPAAGDPTFRFKLMRAARALALA
jgi:hypothetical protein